MPPVVSIATTRDTPSAFGFPGQAGPEAVAMLVRSGAGSDREPAGESASARGAAGGWDMVGVGVPDGIVPVVSSMSAAFVRSALASGS